MKINGKTILSTSSTTTNYVLKQSSTAGTLINSLIYDDGSNIALGTTTPLTGGGASKWITLNGSTYGGGIISSALGVAKGYLYYDNASETFALQGASGVGATIWTNSAERMRITSAGNVGIGTTSPPYKFSVYDTSDGIVGHFGGGVSNYALISFRSNEANVYSTSLGSYNSGMLFRTGATDRMYINSSGNVGIGTTSPSEKLDVSVTKSYNQSADIGIALGGTDNGFVDNFSTSSWRQFVSGNASGQSLRFDGFVRSVGWVERMRITSSGNVGIGTTSPIHQLSVANKIGGILFGDSFLEFPSSGNTILKANNDVIIGYSQNTVITQNGSVGIGTTTPDASALLDVSSTTQGFLPPRMTTSERDAISSPASGLMIWNTDNRQIEVFSVSVWVGL